jgi:hypothetical protein
MRVQLQMSCAGQTPKTYGIPIEAEDEDGVTPLQLRTTMKELYETTTNKAPWFPWTLHRRNLRKAIVLLSQRIDQYAEYGISDIGNIDREPWDGERGRTFRVDIENFRGTNLRRQK